MSLIDEALKRARMEAAQRAAEGEGLPYPTIPRHLGPRRRRAWLAPTVVALAVIVGLLIGWVIASRDSRAEPTAARAGGGTATAAEPVTAGPPTPVQVIRDPVTAAAETTEPVGSAASPPRALAEPAPAAPTPEPTGAQPVTSGPASSDEVTRDPAAPAQVAPPPAETSAGEPAAPRPTEPPPAQPPPAEARSAPPPQEPATAPDPPSATTTVTDPDSGVLLVLPERPSQREAGSAGELPADTVAESYVQRFPLASGGAIELGGIAWSETGPFALINGRVVGPGSIIDEYTLERIRPGHVVLTGQGHRIHLSLQ